MTQRLDKINKQCERKRFEAQTRTFDTNGSKAQQTQAQ